MKVTMEVVELHKSNYKCQVCGAIFIHSIEYRELTMIKCGSCQCNIPFNKEDIQIRNQLIIDKAIRDGSLILKDIKDGNLILKHIKEGSLILKAEIKQKTHNQVG